MALVKDYMREDFYTISVKDTATQASKAMLEHGVGYIIVLEGAKPRGIVTERDLVLKILAEERNPKTATVSECMSTPIISIEPDKSVYEAVDLMKKHGFRRLPVVKGDIIYGIFTARELVEHFDSLEKKLTTDLLRFFPF
jgi:CBS domain-containing protein